MTYPYLKRLPRFEYLAPETIQEALVLLTRNDSRARVLAGGTDLLLKMKTREESPLFVIGLKNIPGLDYIQYDVAEGLRLGPLTTVHSVEASSLIKDKYPVLAQAASTLGSVQVRNLATVVGNLCSALPSADMAPGLIALGAKLKILGVNGERSVTVEDFFLEPGVSALHRGEIVTEIQAPVPPPHTGMCYLKHMLRSAMDLSIVGASVVVTLDGDICQDVKISLGTVGPVPMRARVAEEILKGNRLSDESVQRAAQVASEECNPRSSKRASAEYRREIVKVLTEKALREALTQVK